jgi:hypothetical protein
MSRRRFRRMVRARQALRRTDIDPRAGRVFRGWQHERPIT